MKKRRLSREFAFQFLYQCHANGLFTSGFTGEFTEKDFENFTKTTGEKVLPDREFARNLSEGVCKNIEEIDSKIETFSEHWKISRMSPVDINIMRVAVYELLYINDIDKAVSINEAVEIASKYGTEKSRAFVNGVLDRIPVEKTIPNA